MANGQLRVVPVHRFSAIHRRLRDEWFATVESSDTWIDDGAIGEGESESRRLINQTTGHVGVGKPGLAKATDEHCRAAHEKLAFDLSCLIGLTVCPVVLWPQDAGAKFARGRSISSWAFPQSKKWSEAEHMRLISDQHRASAGPMISAMRVFHTWIGDTDRKDAHVHIDLNSPTEELVIAFYDHAFCLSYAWKGPGAPMTICPDYMKQWRVPEVREVMDEAAACIERLDDEEVTRLVERIPSVYLPEPHRGDIISNLLSRKRGLRAIVAHP